MNTESLLDFRVASAFYGKFKDIREAQKAVIEPIINGQNIVLTSGTGSGKTEAVIAPLVSKYWLEAIKKNELFIIYLAPTKALVNDVEKRLRSPLNKLGLCVGVRHGDQDDIKRSSAPHVLITTPESLDVLLFRKEKVILSIRAIVIDEVHLLYNTQRGLQLSVLLRRLCRLLDRELQWVAISATVGELSFIKDFLFGSDKDAILFSFSAQRAIDAQIRHFEQESDISELVDRLISGRDAKLLIFANSRRDCERLSSILKQNESLRHCIFTHYSSLSTEVRLDTEHKFSSMRTAICVATSTLELGIDIGDIDAVILWGVPGGVDSFLQRIGRGNRRSNKTNVICLIPNGVSSIGIEALRFYALIDAAKKCEMPVQRPYDLFGAVGQQCLSIIASDSGRFIKISDLCKFFEHKNYLNRPTIESVLSSLSDNDFIQRHGYKNRYGAGESLYKLVDMKLIYGNFGIGSQTIDVYHSSRRLGDVPISNMLRLRRGIEVRFSGRHWIIEKISRDGIYLKPAKPSPDVVDFSYEGSVIMMDSFMTDRIWHIMHDPKFDASVLTKHLTKQVINLCEKIRAQCTVLQIPFFRSAEGVRYFTFGGYLINKAIGLYTRKLGFKADEISLLVPSRIEWAQIPSDPQEYNEFFHLIFEVTSRQSIFQQQLPIDLQQREFIQDWLKDITIERILKRLNNSEPMEIDNQIAHILGF